MYPHQVCTCRYSYAIKSLTSKVVAAFGFVAALLVLLPSSAYAVTVAQFTGGEFYYDGTTFTTASAPSTAGVSSLASITNPFSFSGTAPMTLNITGVTKTGGWDVIGPIGVQLFSGGSFNLSDSSGTLLAGTISDSAFTAPTGNNPQVASIFSFNVVDYTTISPNLNTGLSAPLPGSYSISMQFSGAYSTPTVTTPTGLPDPFNATGTGTFNAVPVPPAIWLFGSGLLGIVAIARRKKAA
jgi:hypothetical protein